MVFDVYKICIFTTDGLGFLNMYASFLCYSTRRSFCFMWQQRWRNIHNMNVENFKVNSNKKIHHKILLLVAIVKI